ncbi:MAG TPA: transcription antitermination factor NusB [Candidatus Mcinerneyibacteriales bacterium]|nr:transcription antitermination factor NusB [Candidatus Mcinerneyibacteriales bacterium]
MMAAMDVKDKKAVRDSLLQWLYAYLFTKNGKGEASKPRGEEALFGGMESRKAASFQTAVSLLAGRMPEIEEYIRRTFTGSFDELHLVEKALVYLCVFEFTVLKTDKKLVISEGLRLSDKYASQNFDKKLHAYVDSLE